MTSFIKSSAPQALAKYEPYIKTGNYVYISGQIPIENGKISDSSIGKLGGELSIEKGKKIAEICTKNLLLQLNKACGGDANNIKFDAVKQCIKITVFINSIDNFTNQPLVADAASEMLLQELGKEKGRHARAAVGVSQLPKGVAVEIDGIFELAG